MPETMRILLLEDDEVDAELLVMALKRAGFKFEWNRVDSEEDYTARLHEKPDLIFSDCRMPRFNAFRALELRKEAGLITPFIIMSGTIEEETAALALKQGATACLIKGQTVDLKKVVLEALGKAAS